MKAPLTCGARGSLLLVLLLCGCANVDRASVAKFGEAVDAARLQTRAAFESVNELVLPSQIETAAAKAELDLDDLTPFISPENAQKWDDAFRQIEMYAMNLQLLLSPEGPDKFRDSILAFGKKLEAMDASAAPDAAMRGGFARLGRALVKHAANAEAADVLKETDPAIQEIFKAMAGGIGNQDKEMLLKTVTLHWSGRIVDEQVAFKAAKTLAEKRAIVVKVAQMVKKRDAQLSALRTLRNSFRALAEAHAALAEDPTVDLSSVLAMIREELAELRDLMKSLKAPS